MLYPNGTTVPENTIEYSVERYCLAYNRDDAVRPMVRALQDYGANAWSLFNGGASGDVQPQHTNAYDLSPATDEAIAAYRFSLSGSVEGVSLSAASLALESATDINVKFTVGAGHEIGEYTCTVDGAAVTPLYDGSRYVLVAGNIAAKELDHAYVIEISRGEETLTLIYSALSYADMVVRSGSSSEVLKDTVRALYLYNQKANDYFG